MAGSTSREQLASQPITKRKATGSTSATSSRLIAVSSRSLLAVVTKTPLNIGRSTLRKKGWANSASRSCVCLAVTSPPTSIRKHWLHRSQSSSENFLQKGADYENLRLLTGCVVTWDRSPCRSAQGLCCRRESNHLFRISTPGPRISEGRKHRRATARSTIAFSADGAILECPIAGRWRGVLFGPTERIQPAIDGRSKGVVSERHRTIARPARIFGLVVAQNRLCEGHHRDPRSSQAAFQRASLRCELDCRHCSYRTSKPFPSEEGSAGRVSLVRGER